jgi:hypothetical protein
MDLNWYSLKNNNLGRFLVQSALSLLPEDENNCTEIVPGYDNGELDALIDKLDSEGKLQKQFVTTDLKKFPDILKRMVPVPSPEFGLRATRSTVPHGSTEKATMDRIVVFNWLEALTEESGWKKTEFPKTLSVDEIRDCHSQLTGPSVECLGHTVNRKVDIRFPPNVSLPSTSAIGDALLCRRTWEDSAVVMELDILFGIDKAAADRYVANTRRRLITAYRFCFEQLVENEKSLYGGNSFFNQEED